MGALQKGLRLGVIGAMAAIVLPWGVAHPQDATAELRLRLVTDADVPVPGALVALVSADDSVADEGLTSRDGLRVLRAPSGIYRVRVRRIGFYPFLSAPISIPRAGELLLRLDTQRVLLDTVRVTVRSECGSRAREAETIVALWNEIAKALRASQLTLGDLAEVGRARVYWTGLDAAGAVLWSDTTSVPVEQRKPFGAADPAVLARRGYVRGDEYNGWMYYAPDERVLLSEEFAATHCFGVIRQATRPGQIGLVFEPAAGRRRSDIRGVLWVDEATAELRETRFSYVNAGVATRYQPSGFTRFRRMPSGAWLVDEWWLRLPRVFRRPGAYSNIVLQGYQENGGALEIGASDDRRPRVREK
ncbi:hypothetical protein BH23GEM2_BH23GEM2_02770 [soil metagenome]